MSAPTVHPDNDTHDARNLNTRNLVGTGNAVHHRLVSNPISIPNPGRGDGGVSQSYIGTSSTAAGDRESSVSNNTESDMHPDAGLAIPVMPHTPTTTTTTTRPYSSSGPGTYYHNHHNQILRPAPSLSARTSFTRVGPEDEEESPPFPARPATAAAATTSALGSMNRNSMSPGIGLFRPRLEDLPSSSVGMTDDGAGAGGSVVSVVSVDGEGAGEESAMPPPSPREEQPASKSSPPPTAQSPQLQATIPTSPPPVPTTPQAFITFLLISGSRRTMAFEPETTIGRVKELIWNTWPEDGDWQSLRPPAPSYLRLLYLGRLLQDDDTITKLKIPTSNLASPPYTTIVHISIRPYAPTKGAENNENLGKKRSLARRLSGEDMGDANTGCCGCIIC